MSCKGDIHIYSMKQSMSCKGDMEAHGNRLLSSKVGVRVKGVKGMVSKG